MPDLTGLPVLDVAIGMALLYLLLGLFLSAIQETVAAVLNWRAKMLERGIRNLLAGHPAPDDEQSKAADAAKNALYSSPFITALYRKATRLTGKLGGNNEGQRLPSYIAPRTFALALLDTFAPDAGAPAGRDVKPEHDLIADMREALTADGSPLPAPTRRALVRILDQSHDDIDRLRTGIEQWFDDSMARVSGWYKRKTQLVLCILAAGTAVGLNVDSVVVAQTLWKQPELRAVVVDAATKPGGVGTTSTLPGDSPADQAANGLESVKKLNLPLGWSKNPNDPRHVSLSHHALAKLVGWLITFLALSFGAPFWFDALSRFSRLRSSGKPEAPLPAPGRGLPGERVK
jgi:hypothetical protein